MLVGSLIFLCGCLVSGFGTMIGFGGGIFMVPILVVVFQVKMQLAVGAVALALFPATLIATGFNSREGTVDYWAALWLEIPTIFGAVLGAYLTSILSVQKMEVIFAFFLIYLSIKMIRSSNRSPYFALLVNFLNHRGPQLQRVNMGTPYRIGLPAATLFGGVSGVIAGMFGIGGGFLKTPIMIRVFRMPPRIAVGTALLVIVFTSLASSISHISLGHIQWDLSVPLVTGFSLGAVVGNLLKKTFTETHTEKMISYGIFLAGCSLLVHSVQS
jgi:uncharacterized protein